MRAAVAVLTALAHFSCIDAVHLGTVPEAEEEQFMGLLAGSWEGSATMLVGAHTLELPLKVTFSSGGYTTVCDSGAMPPTVPCVTFAPSGTFQSFHVTSTGSAFAEATEAISIEGTYIVDASVALDLRLDTDDALVLWRTWKARARPFADYAKDQAESFLQLLFGDLGPPAAPPAEEPPKLDDVVSSFTNITLKRVR
jgi:hypothetical protein